MSYYGSWPEEQWRYAVTEEEEKKKMRSRCQKRQMEAGEGNRMVSGTSKGLNVLEKSGKCGVSDA